MLPALTGARSGTHLNKKEPNEKQKSSNLKNADASSSKLVNDLKHKRGHSLLSSNATKRGIKDSFVPKESDSHSTSLHGSPASSVFWSTMNQRSSMPGEVPFSERPLKVN